MTAPALPAALEAGDLLRLWPAQTEGTPAMRLGVIARAVWGAQVEADTLGRRNQRALVLHRALVGRDLEARVICPDCGAENEAVLPVDAVLADETPPDDAVVRVQTRQGVLDFALPRARDLFAADATRLAQRLCRGQPAAAFDADDLARIAAAWEAADPAGAVELALACCACSRGLSALADPVAFAARDLDIAADRLMREIDVIARVYGWSEPAILALPAARRQRYVAMILATETRRPGSVGRRA